MFAFPQCVTLGFSDFFIYLSMKVNVHGKIKAVYQQANTRAIDPGIDLIHISLFEAGLFIIRFSLK